MKKSIIMSGYGKVGKEFIRLISDKKDLLNKKYNLELLVSGIIGRNISIYEENGIDLQAMLHFGKGSPAIYEYCKLKELNSLQTPIFKGDLLVEAASTDINSGEPGLSLAKSAILNDMDIAFLSKGALITNFKELMALAKSHKRRIKYSGATAAALPTLDVGEYSLAGTEILSIKGILNGTSNFILSEMYNHNSSFEEALKHAKDIGIAESNCFNDISGIDSACKLLLLSNSLMDTEADLKDIYIRGIQHITFNEILNLKAENKIIKLVARAERNASGTVLTVKPETLSKEHYLSSIEGINKAIVYNTDSMGQVMISGGASNPRAAAAAALKDIINLYAE